MSQHMQQQQEQEQEQDQHPYASLYVYESILFAAEPAEFNDGCPSSSSSSSSSQQQPDGTTSSSSSFNVTNQSPSLLPLPLPHPIHATTITTSIYTDSSRVKKRQKTSATTNKLTSTTTIKLDDSSSSTVATTKWADAYQRLVAYKEEHGDCTKVPKNYKKDRQLGNWVDYQRRVNRSNSISKERKHLLNSIGFAWDGKAPGTSTATWEEMYERLLAYKTEHNNDTNVPKRYEKDPQLGSWVANQRTRVKSITTERKHSLNSIGFLWDGKAPGTSTATWEEMYQRLVAYKTEHNDTIVPKRYGNDPPLGSWVANQRTNYRLNRKAITEERKHSLNSIGFVWDRKAQDPVALRNWRKRNTNNDYNIH